MPKPTYLLQLAGDTHGRIVGVVCRHGGPEGPVATPAETAELLRKVVAQAASDIHATDIAEAFQPLRDVADKVEAGEIPVLPELPPGAVRI